MARKSYKPEEVVSKLRRAVVLLAEGVSLAEALPAGKAEVVLPRM